MLNCIIKKLFIKVAAKNTYSFIKIFHLSVIYRQAAIELNRKSQMISEAVEEVLSLVDKATETFKEIAGNDVVTLFDGKRV